VAGRIDVETVGITRMGDTHSSSVETSLEANPVCSSEKEILIACTRRAFMESHRDRVLVACRRGRVAWDRLLSTAKEHQVAPLLYRNLRASEGVLDLVPESVQTGFRTCLIDNAVRWRVLKEETRILVKYFASHDHQVMLVKGASAVRRLVDESYEFTMFNDSDAVVRPMPDAAGEWDAGRTRGAVDAYYRVHERTLFEIDNRIHHDANMHGVIPIDFDRIWADAEGVPVDGGVIYIPNKHDLLINSCINFIRTKKFKLRKLHDINELIDGYDSADWEEVARRARGYRCSLLVYSTVQATNSVLGCELDGAALELLRPGALRAWSIGHVARRLSPQVEDRPRGRSPWSFTFRAISLSARQFFRWYWLNKIVFLARRHRRYPLIGTLASLVGRNYYINRSGITPRSR
jgi:hypothetical protein